MLLLILASFLTNVLLWFRTESRLEAARAKHEAEAEDLHEKIEKLEERLENLIN